MRHVLMMIAAAFLLVACESEGPAEEAGAAVDEAAEEVRDEIDDLDLDAMADDAEEAAEEAADDIEQAAEDVQDELDE